MLLTDCRFLITQNETRDILEDVDIQVEDGQITEIGTQLTRDDECIDCSDKVVLPGLVNAHTHAAMNVMRGISDNKLLQDWLEEDIFPAEDRLTDDDIYQGTLHAVAEMLQTGTTCFNDMYIPEQPVAAAVDDTGMRAVLGYTMVDIASSSDDELRTGKTFITDWQGHDRITPAAAPHAVYTCSAELLQAAYEQAERYDVPYHIHLSETAQENADCVEAHGMEPAPYLDDLDVLDERTVAAHGVHLSAQDRALLASHDTGVAHNPCANLKLGSGVAPVPALQETGVTVGLGTDSVASNNNLNLFEEMKFAALLQKEQDPQQMDAQTVLDMATRDSAQLLDLDDRIGQITPGYQADLVCIDLDTSTMTPFYGTQGVLSNLVFAFNGRATHVFVDGEQVVDEGTVTTVNRSAVRTEVQACTERLQE